MTGVARHASNAGIIALFCLLLLFGLVLLLCAYYYCLGLLFVVVVVVVLFCKCFQRFKPDD